jgi:hypothetical protein
MRHFHFEDIVTLVEQLLLFAKSFSNFFALAHFFESRQLTNPASVNPRRLASPLEELDCPLMFLRLLERIEGPEISTFPGPGILLSGVKPVLARL